MNEEQVNESVESLEPSSDLTTVVESVNLLVETMQAENEAEALAEEEEEEAEVENTEVLKTILETLQPSEEEIQAQAVADETEMESLQAIKQELILLNETITEEMPKVDLVTEGFFFIGLSVMISLAVYMFWNQLSKW